MPDSTKGQVYLLDDDPRDREIVFSFPVDDEINDAVRQLPGRWFDWRRKNWRVPANPRLAGPVESVLARFPSLEPSPEVLDWPLAGQMPSPPIPPLAGRPNLPAAGEAGR